MQMSGRAVAIDPLVEEQAGWAGGLLTRVFDDNVSASRREMHALHLQRAAVLRRVWLEELQHVIAGIVLSRNHVLGSHDDGEET